MGKITELSQGSLNGLRRQLNECIENAYNKGYADGKKEPIESHGEQEYNRGIEDASNLLAFVSRDFIQECFPNEKGWDLFDLNAKYGLAVVIKEFKKWQEQKKQAEEEIKVGDWVEHFENTFIVTRTPDSDTLDMICTDGACYYGVKPSECKKLDKPDVADKLQALFEDLEGDK